MVAEAQRVVDQVAGLGSTADTCDSSAIAAVDTYSICYRATALEIKPATIIVWVGTCIHKEDFNSGP